MMKIEDSENGYMLVFKSMPDAYEMELNADKSGKSNTIRELTPDEKKFVMENEIDIIKIVNVYDGRSFVRKLKSIIDCEEYFDLKIDENCLVMFCWSA